MGLIVWSPRRTSHCTVIELPYNALLDSHGSPQPTSFPLRLRMSHDIIAVDRWAHSCCNDGCDGIQSR